MALVLRIYLLMQEMKETCVLSLDQEDLLEKEMATHSSVLFPRILWTEEPEKSDMTKVTQHGCKEVFS